jgi:hypothetical protein
VPCPIAGGEKTAPLKTTLCEVVREPGRFACKRIAFRATIESDCLEHSSLTDPACERGVIPMEGESASPTVDAVFREACPLMPGKQIDFSRTVTASFVGVFHWRHQAIGDELVVDLENAGDVSIAKPAAHHIPNRSQPPRPQTE